MINLAILVRKIARAKWPEEICSINMLNGDAISDLRTTNNTISLWRVDSEAELPTAMLALAASSKSSKIENVSLVWFSEEAFFEKNIQLDANSPGDTIVSDLAPFHRDACRITYKSLGDLATLIMAELIQEKHYRRFGPAAVKEALVSAYKEHRIAEEKCMPDLLEEIKKAAQQTVQQ